MHRNGARGETSVGNTIFSLKLLCQTLVSEYKPAYKNIERFVIRTVEPILRFRLKGIVMYEIFSQKLKR